MDNKSNIFFWGLGNFGIKFYELFKDKIQKPIFWIDAKKYGQTMQGINKISPKEFWAYFNGEDRKCCEVEVVVTARSMAALEITAEILKHNFFFRGGKPKFAIAEYSDKYFTDHRNEMKTVLNMLGDDISVKIYNSLVDNMRNGRLLDLSLHTEKQYYPNSIIKRFDDTDVIGDVGVCDGEEIDVALGMNRKVKIIAFEPNSESCEKLQLKYRKQKNVRIYPWALWDKSTTLLGSGSGLSYKTIEVSAKEGGVKTVRLDDVVKERIDFIKMDIEGAEMKALLGAKNTISMYRPNLAICIYHNIEDYIEIPLLIKSLDVDNKYRYYVRQHSADDTETVFYAIRCEESV